VRHYSTSCSWPVSSVENGRVLVYCAGEKYISEAIASINQRTLRRVAQNVVKRVNACTQENGGHFQHSLWTVLQVLFYCSITKWKFGCVLKWISFVTAHVLRAWMYECAAYTVLKELKISSDCGESGSKKCKRGCGGTYGSVWRKLRLAGIWSLDSGGRFCVCTFDRYLASVATEMSHLIYFKNTIFFLLLLRFMKIMLQ
jgi:hypothetical protein